MDVDVLDRDLLLPLAAITLERLDLHNVRAEQFLTCVIIASISR
jgi:hypothetical protein